MDLLALFWYVWDFYLRGFGDLLGFLCARWGDFPPESPEPIETPL